MLLKGPDWLRIHCLLQCKHRVPFLKAIALDRKIEIRSIVEIGVYQGLASRLFRFFFPKATLYLVDPWKLYEEYSLEKAKPISKEGKNYEAAYRRVKRYFKNDRRTKILRMTSKRAAAEIPDGLDLVFIDGNHSYEYVREDIALWLPKVRAGGILSGHDYHAALFPGVVQAVDEAFERTRLLGPDETWFVLKKDR